MCNFIEYKDLQIVYKRYASLQGPYTNFQSLGAFPSSKLGLMRPCGNHIREKLESAEKLESSEGSCSHESPESHEEH